MVVEVAEDQEVLLMVLVVQVHLEVQVEVEKVVEDQMVEPMELREQPTLVAVAVEVNMQVLLLTMVQMVVQESL